MKGFLGGFLIGFLIVWALLIPVLTGVDYTVYKLEHQLMFVFGGASFAGLFTGLCGSLIEDMEKRRYKG